MKQRKYMLGAEYLVIDAFTEEVSMIDKYFNNKILSDEIDYEFEDYDTPDPWFKSLFDNIYEVT